MSAVDARRSSRWDSRRTVKVIVGAGAVALAVLSLWWWTHPTAFNDLGDSVRVSPRPVSAAAMSTTVIFPNTDGDSETVTIDDVQADFSTNTANAAATFSICHLSPGEDPMGAVPDPAVECRDIEPVEPGTTFYRGTAPESDYLFVTISPTAPGVAHLEQVEVTYHRGARHLFQRGTQTLRVDRKVTAR